MVLPRSCLAALALVRFATAFVIPARKTPLPGCGGRFCRLPSPVRPPSKPALVVTSSAMPTGILASEAPPQGPLLVAMDGGLPLSVFYGVSVLVLAIAAGYLIFTTYTGDDGLEAFLSKEKKDNPFYKGTVKKFRPTPPKILDNIKLPSLDFVDVYGAEPEDPLVGAGEAGGTGVNNPEAVAGAEELRAKMLAAVEREDYAAATKLEGELREYMRSYGISFDRD